MDSSFKKTLLGYGLMFLFTISWVSSGAAVQVLGRRVPDFELGTVRYIGTMLCAALLMCFNKRAELELPKESYLHVLLMVICSIGFNCLYFFAVPLLPLSHVSFSLVCIMIMTTVISKVLFDKTHNIFISISNFGCILGMLFLVQPWKPFTHGFTPGFMTSTANHNILSQHSTTNESGASNPTWWLLFGYLTLLGSAVFDTFYLILAGVYLKKVKPALLTFLTSGLAIPMCILGSFYLEQPVFITNPYDILLVSIHVITTAVAMLCQTAVCQLISPIHVSIALNLIPVLNLILQYTILGDNLYGRRNVLEVAGCILIVVSVTLSGLFNNEEKHEDF